MYNSRKYTRKTFHEYDEPRGEGCYKIIAIIFLIAMAAAGYLLLTAALANI